MAEFIRRVLSITTQDGVLRPMVWQAYVSQAAADTYWAATDDAGRAASDIGILIADYLACQDGAFVNSSLALEIVNDPVSNPADTVLRGNKILIHVRAGGRGLVTSIPARKTSAYTQETDSLKIDITATGALKTFLTKYAAVVEDAFGNNATPVAAEIVD